MTSGKDIHEAHSGTLEVHNGTVEVFRPVLQISTYYIDKNRDPKKIRRLRGKTRTRRICIKAMLRVLEILVRIPIRGSILRLMDPDPDADPDPAFFVSEQQK
jgi:hypothetical protein